MEEPYDYTQEDHAREVERVLMYIAQAQRKAEEIAAALEKDGAEERFVNGVRTAAAALWAEHNRLLNTTHFPVPDGPPAKPDQQSADGGSLLDEAADSDGAPPADQQRMAI
ncbi:MAG: hypothetical protein ACRDKX_00180 [Solirubrobacterales bacterium]